MANHDNSIVRNNIKYNTYQGIWVLSTAYDIMIAQNEISNNGRQGIRVEGDTNSIHHNTITNHVLYNGILLTASSNLNSVHHNVLSGNAIPQINDQGPDNEVFKNTISP